MTDNSSSRVWMNFQGPNFRMKVPSDWYIVASPTVQAMFLEPVGNQRLRGNMMITLRPIQEGLTLADVSVAALETQAAGYPQFSLIDEQDITVSGVRGKYRLYQWFNAEDNIPVVQAQAFFVARDLLITMTATCDLERQAGTMPVFNAMFDSLELQLAEQSPN